ncbi:MAG TPA: SLC13 family permease [Burkholderiales bacterium]
MSLALLSLIALFVAIVLGTFTQANVGILSIAGAFAIGVLIGGMPLKEVAAGFPVSLFLTLVAVTFLFAQARANGTLERVSAAAVRVAAGHPGYIPFAFFGLALAFATLGPGNIATTALLAPVAMAAAGRAGIPAFLMALMVCNGANAGALSPFAPTGIIANGLMARIGLEGHEWRNYFNALLPQTAVALAGYLALGGWRLMRQPRADAPGVVVDATGVAVQPASTPLDWRQKLTLAVIAALIVSVAGFKVDVTFGAFVAAVVLSLAGAAQERAAVAAMPWATILMVCGVTVLIALVEKTGGMDLFTTLLAQFSTRETITGVIAFVTGVISVYSSSSGVVLPAFLPTIPGLVDKLGGGDPLGIAASINVGAHLVDVSPLSTLGALCIAAAAPEEDRKALFNRMLAWGLSMSVVGALVCWLFFGVLFA